MVAADLKLGGFNGTWGAGAAIDRKRALLEKEGVVFDKTGRIVPGAVHEFSSADKQPQQERKRARADR